MQLLIDAYTRQYPDFAGTTIPSLGSAGSIKALAAGALAIAVTSRPMNEAERELPITEKVKTAAEFAETDAIVQQLKATGVDYAQGYGASKPEPLIGPAPVAGASQRPVVVAGR